MASKSLDPSRWQRRAKTIPAMLGVTAVGFIGFPLLAPIVVVADAVRGRLKLPTLRLYLFLLQYAFNDSVEIVLAPLFWLLASFGKSLDSPRSIARHERLQWWSVRLLERRAKQLLGLQLEVDETTLTALGGQGSASVEPIIILSRHVSLFDASLPGLLAHKVGRKVRAVIMAELLADPGFDLLYGRLGSIFIPRDDGPQARQAISTMTDQWQETSLDSGPGDNPEKNGLAVVLFPEGRLYTKSGHNRAMSLLAERDQPRAAKLESLTHLLPPKSGGLNILLDALPTADVVLLNHTGLDSLTRLSRLGSKIPVNQTINVSASRIARQTIPADNEERKSWLDELWLELDRQIDADVMVAE